MANTIAATTETSRGGIFDFIKILLRGTGQVMFQNSAWTGLFFIVGIFWGAYAEGLGIVAWGALVGVIVSTVTGYLLRFPDRDGAQGLWGFNGVLVGCAFPTFMGNTVWMWLALVLCAALTTWVRAGFNNVMAPWKVNSFTFPFVFCTWMFLLAARALHGMPDTHMADPAFPGAFTPLADAGFGHLIVYWLKGIAQVFLIDSWVTGIFFLVGLFLCSRWAALWAAIGSALALVTVLIFRASGPDIAEGLYGYSPVLTAIALATVFYKPGVRSAVWALLGILVTVFIQAGMYMLMAPVGIATLTGPFCIATWLFLLPLIRFDEPHKPDHSNWDPANKTHLAPQNPPLPAPESPDAHPEAPAARDRQTMTATRSVTVDTPVRETVVEVRPEVRPEVQPETPSAAPLTPSANRAAQTSRPDTPPAERPQPGKERPQNPDKRSR